MIKLTPGQTLIHLSGPMLQAITFCKYLESKKNQLKVDSNNRAIKYCELLDNEFFTTDGVDIKTGNLSYHSGVSAAMREYRKRVVTSLQVLRQKLLNVGFKRLPKNAIPAWPWACGNSRDALESIQDTIKECKSGHFEVCNYTIISLAKILDSELDWVFSPKGLNVLDMPAELCEKAWDSCQDEWWVTPNNLFRQPDLGKAVLFYKRG